MTDYTKLVEALRGKFIAYDVTGNHNSAQLYKDSADAIEKLVTLYEKAEMDATNLTGKLAQAEAEVERLKDSNEELREKQTYIDHYGAKWMTSAKDVPTAAYEHGYADGRDEAEAQLPKRGEWVEENRRPRSSQFICSECHRTAYDPQPTRDKAWRKRCRYAYCPNCGAKMEVQE